MHSKRKLVCEFLFTMGVATGTIINAGVAGAVPVDPKVKAPSAEGAGTQCSNGQGHDNGVDPHPDNVADVTDLKCPGKGEDPDLGGDLDPDLGGDDDRNGTEGEEDGGDTGGPADSAGIDIGDALTIVRDQPVPPLIVELPEVAAPVAVTPEALVAAPVAAPAAATVTQQAPKASTPVVVAPVTSTRSAASVTPSSQSEVLGVQYTRLATTGSDPFLLGVLALGLLLLGSVMIRTSRRPS